MKPEDMVVDGFADVEGVADFLAVSRRTVYALMEGGVLPYIKVGRCRRLPWRAVREYAARALTGGWAAAAAPSAEEPVPFPAHNRRRLS